MSTATKPKHIGRNISRIRELRGMKQEALAEAIGLSQQTVSSIEGSEEIETKKLVEIAKVLGVTVEAIENFSEESVFNYFNTYYDTKDSVINAGNNSGENSNNYCTFNPLDKVVELYERLVQVEKEKNEYLEKLLKGK
ncbi:helix-turn-helix domain-containing protein [Flavobacterium aquidurense]|jgi:transcriptional regulator with XRE-family HTH domain|uniref:helix-turn-helix domain-containing protein n=1 Tax=Flavobacterium aquidurense TaxID=362413 RepID=UPI0009116FCC|nr:helix-turn-helix transcriptional regulator [Flavobacterium aquidurense]OXA70533.1 transcriptional regulator [Flavobacterium aquidurense]SHG32892.1 DNA-binding transcriptional regulator, XRE-family HTH domain [Flavobacterium frigidimaris]